MTEFPQSDFYIRAVSAPTQNFVVDVERNFFFSWGAIKESTKTVLALQTRNTEFDAYQLWRYEDGRLVNIQNSFCLEADDCKQIKIDKNSSLMIRKCLHREELIKRRPGNLIN